MVGSSRVFLPIGPPGRELVDLIVKSSSPILRALDDHKGGAAA